ARGIEDQEGSGEVSDAAEAPAGEVGGRVRVRRDRLPGQGGGLAVGRNVPRLPVAASPADGNTEGRVAAVDAGRARARQVPDDERLVEDRVGLDREHQIDPLVDVVVARAVVDRI